MTMANVGPEITRTTVDVFTLTVTRVRDLDADGNAVNDEYTMFSGEKMLGENLRWYEIDDVFLEEVSKGENPNATA